MRHFLFAAIIGLVLVACQWFSSPAYTDAQGVHHSAKTGIIDQVAGGARASGIPYGGAAAGIIGIIGALGTWIQHRDKNKKADTQVAFFDEFKRRVKDLTSDEDVETLIGEFSDKNPKWGKWIKKGWRRARGL